MIEQILTIIKRKRRVLILTHNNPDPDAMAAAFGIKYIIHQKLRRKKVTIAYRGIIGRVENKELVRRCKLEMVQSDTLDFTSFDYIIVVDTQPNAGNVYLPPSTLANVVIDHHLIPNKKSKLAKEAITDIRANYGSTSTIVSEYLSVLGIKPDVNVATALCVGIMSDIMGAARDSGNADKEMLGYIYPFVSTSKLVKIDTPDLPRYHFKTLQRAIDKAILVNSTLLYTDLGDVRNPDLIAESADYLIRMREIKCVFIIGKVDGVATFSLRHRSARYAVGKIALKLVRGLGYGGGHMKSAGGQIPLENNVYEDVVLLLITRLKKALGILNSEEKSI